MPIVVVSPAFTETAAGSKPNCAVAAGGTAAGGVPGTCAAGTWAPAAAPGVCAAAAEGAAAPVAMLAPAGSGGVITTDSRRILGFVSLPQAILPRFSPAVLG